MSTLLKDFYTEKRIQRIAAAIHAYYPEFQQGSFIDAVLSENWQALELKQRQFRLSQCLFDTIDLAYPQKIDIISKAAATFSSSVLKPEGNRKSVSQAEQEDLGNFEYMFFPGVIEHFGLDEPWHINMLALETMTQYSSSEFAVRPFIIQSSDEMMQQMLTWSSHDNYHVRRLASEGCRPRLPWGIALKAFQKDPSAILPILENLKADSSLYVRRSVANNLNDISKDHPDLVLDICKRWQGNSQNTDWLIKHALRTLLKQGNAQAMALFGLHKPDHIEVTSFKLNPNIKIGNSAPLVFSLKSRKVLGLCRLEYAIDFLKKNGSHNHKLFKISESYVGTDEKDVTRHIRFKTLSTRKLYPGTHHIHLIVNGHILASQSFELYN